MARAERPVSESYRPKCCSVSQSVSYSTEAGTVGLEDEDDRAPILSLSKSSMDVVMATGPPHKRDPAWTRMDLRRSFSSTTQSEQNLVKVQQLYPHMQQHISATDNLQLFLTTQNMDMHSPPSHSGRWIADMQRWSGCSGNTHSRSSTPETVVWKVGTSRPSSLTQDTPSLAAPHSPISKPASPPTTPSPFISPLHTPTLSPVDLLACASPLTLSTNQQEDLLMSSPAPSPLPSSPKAHTSSPLPYNSCDLQLSDTENEGFLENNLLSFQFPSPVLSSVNLAEAGESGPRCHAADLIEELLLPRDMQLSEEGGVGSPVHMFSYLAPTSPAEGHELGREASVCHLELPWQPDQSCLAGRGWRSHLVSSLSESRLGDSCRCNLNPRQITAKVFREEGTMTLQIQTVDAAVQTVSPIGSWWDLRRNISTSNMGSHSILGSPPGSRLNLKSSVGSNSNLVSPSSSMFPVSSGEEERQGDDPAWDVSSASSHDLDRRRPCLKIQVEEKDELGRRSSMKQVQWDEDGMTWDIHGTSVDTEVLNMAIQKHLELDNSPRPQRRTSKKKKAPKPPLISNVVKAITPELNPPVMIITSSCMAEGQNEGTPEAGDRREVEEVEDTKEETVEVIRRISRAEGQNTKEEDEACEDESTSHTKSLSHGCGRSRKKSVIRSLRRPGWCGSSRKEDD